MTPNDCDFDTSASESPLLPSPLDPRIHMKKISIKSHIFLLKSLLPSINKLMVKDLASTLTCDLPGEVIIDILSRLPVKTLIKFKCVNKSWCSLLKDPSFIKMHMEHSSTAKDDSFIVIGSKGPIKNESELSIIPPETNKWNPMGIRESGKLGIIGSSNGLICLSPYDPRFGCHFMIMNPALREAKFVCKKHTDRIENRRTDFMSIGFGYDERHHDFKILRIERIQPASGQMYSDIYIYSLNANSWNKLECSTTIKLRNHVAMAAFHSCIYWLGLVGNERMIIEFDLSIEKFNNIPLPESGRPDCTQIAEWRQNALAAIFYDPEDYSVQVWTWSRNGNREQYSWKMEMTYRFEGLTVTICASRRNGDFAFYSRNKDLGLVYLKEKNKLVNPGIPKYGMDFKICCYRESLVPVNGKKLMGSSKTKLQVVFKNFVVVLVCVLFFYVMYVYLLLDKFRVPYVTYVDEAFSRDEEL